MKRYVFLLLLLLAACANPRQFLLTERTDNNGVEILEGSAIPVFQGGYDTGLTITPELRDNGLEQLIFSVFRLQEQKTASVHQRFHYAGRHSTLFQQPGRAAGRKP